MSLFGKIMGRDGSDVDVKQANNLVKSGEAMLLDVRSAEEFKEVRSPDAILIPLPELDRRIQEVPDSQTICVICHAGGRSAIAAGKLRAAGRSQVFNVTGGMAAWEKVGLPTAKG
jgi:hydroxyacylglutathione hydrolase